MSVSILSPDDLATITCVDTTCAQVFQTPKPIVEVINVTALPMIVFHQVPMVCPKCGATYRFIIGQVQTSYGLQRLDVGLVVPPGRGLHLA